MSPILHRAYALLTVKSVDVEHRILTGIATTPEPDRLGDVIEPLGVSFKNPIPLLLFHDHKNPVGTVKFDKPTKDGIGFEARLPEIAEPGLTKDAIDRAWQLVKLKLVRGVSIGFRPINDAMDLMKDTGGIRFRETEVLELSLVTVPANARATIHTIKSFDTGLAASGTEPPVEPPTPSGVSDTARVVSTTRKDARRMAKTITEQIAAFEATRQAKAARRTEIMTKAGDEGVTLDAAQTEEYDGLDIEIKALDAHLTRLEALEKENKAAAVPVAGQTAKAASDSRGGVITLKQTVPLGTAFTRYAMALAAGRGSRLEASEYAKRWDGSTPEVGLVLKAAMAAGTTTDSDWAAPLVVYQNMAGEFIELLRPATIIGRIPGLRRVPFNITMPRQTQGASFGWVGEAKPKIVGELKFDQVSLGMSIAAGIVVLSEKLIRSSSPSAEEITRGDMIAGMAKYLDAQFVDPSVAAVANVSPASITFGVTPIPSTGTNFAALQADVKSLFATFTAANLSVAGSVWLMRETQAQALSMMLNALGQPSIPGITMTGGTMFGLPVITSENIPLDGGSPEGSRIILVKAPEIMLADDGGVTIDVSREASVQMNSTPDDPATASTVLVSLWQHNLVGLRAERTINWGKRRDAAVGYINSANYV